MPPSRWQEPTFVVGLYASITPTTAVLVVALAAAVVAAEAALLLDPVAVVAEATWVAAVEVAEAEVVEVAEEEALVVVEAVVEAVDSTPKGLGVLLDSRARRLHLIKKHERFCSNE